MAALPDLIGNEISDLTEYFERTKNPAAAALAYSLARQHRRAVPDEIQAEVDRFMACIGRVAERAIQTETDGFGETIIKKSGDSKNEDTTRTHPINFRAPELYAAWRGGGGDNPIGQLQTEWRDSRIFAAIQTLVDRGVRPGLARDMVKASGRVNIDLHSIEQIWKRLKTKKQKRPAIRRDNG